MQPVRLCFRQNRPAEQNVFYGIFLRFLPSSVTPYSCHIYFPQQAEERGTRNIKGVAWACRVKGTRSPDVFRPAALSAAPPHHINHPASMPTTFLFLRTSAQTTIPKANTPNVLRFPFRLHNHNIDHAPGTKSQPWTANRPSSYQPSISPGPHIHSTYIGSSSRDYRDKIKRPNGRRHRKQQRNAQNPHMRRCPKTKVLDPPTVHMHMYSPLKGDVLRLRLFGKAAESSQRTPNPSLARTHQAHQAHSPVPGGQKNAPREE